MEFLLPEERDEVILVVGEQSDAIETVQERRELERLEPGVEAQAPDTVAVQEKGETVVSILAVVDDDVIGDQLKLVNGEMDIALRLQETRQAVEELTAETLRYGVSPLVQTLGLLCLDE